jgi:esterase/lipase superfamily enzyme
MLAADKTSTAFWLKTFGCICVLLVIAVGCSRAVEKQQAGEADQPVAQTSDPTGDRSVELAMQDDTVMYGDSAAIDNSVATSPPPSMSAPKPLGPTNSIQRRSAPPASGAQRLEPKSLEPRSLEPQSVEPLAMQSFSAESRSFDADPFSSLPAGTTRDTEAGYATVQVFYATDRMRDDLPLSAYDLSGQKNLFVMLGGASICLFTVAGFFWMQRNPRAAGMVTMLAGGCSALAVACIAMGQATIEKHGVTYNGERGRLVRGICQVTVPDVHQRGVVERPSLLRFEIHENQREHIVLTSAVELSENDFHQRLADTVASSPSSDLLVFIHGYNVDFQSAVRRTAQIAIDLPFEGVPICYSWPSQGTLVGYPIDENNAEWTEEHLREFLIELASQSGAKSINVVAHSMGNRPMTAVMRQISWQMNDQDPPLFDRIVLAAPDVDADRFRRDLAPALALVANQVTLYASSNDQALIASKQVHGYPRAGESGQFVVVVPGVETIDVSGIDLSLLGHSYYGDNESMLRDLYEVVRARLPAPQRALLLARRQGEMIYWQLAQRPETLPGGMTR